MYLCRTKLFNWIYGQYTRLWPSITLLGSTDVQQEKVEGNRYKFRYLVAAHIFKPKNIPKKRVRMWNREWTAKRYEKQRMFEEIAQCEDVRTYLANGSCHTESHRTITWINNNNNRLSRRPYSCSGGRGSDTAPCTCTGLWRLRPDAQAGVCTVYFGYNHEEHYTLVGTPVNEQSSWNHCCWIM